MRKVKLTSFSIKGWAVLPLETETSKTSPLPPHYYEVVQCGGVASGGIVAMYVRLYFKCSLKITPNVLADSQMYSSLQSSSWYLYH